MRHYHKIDQFVSFSTLQTAPQSESRNSSYVISNFVFSYTISGNRLPHMCNWLQAQKIA